MFKRLAWNWIAIGLFCSVVALAAEQSPIHWIATRDEDAKVDRATADRLYDEACRWVEDRFSPDGKTIRPDLTIHVGEACPDSTIPRACLSAASGALYMSHWDKASLGAVVQATIALGMLQLMNQQDIHSVVGELLLEDSRNFVDASALARRQANSQTAPINDLRSAESGKE